MFALMSCTHGVLNYRPTHHAADLECGGLLFFLLAGEITEKQQQK